MKISFRTKLNYMLCGADSMLAILGAFSHVLGIMLGAAVMALVMWVMAEQCLDLDMNPTSDNKGE
jgi:hypothetical protein